MSGAACIVLEDGLVLRGRSVGAPGTRLGEMAFTTGMTGYQEVLTDPSYREQIVTMTASHVGNYGVNEEDVESDRVQVADGTEVAPHCLVDSDPRRHDRLLRLAFRARDDANSAVVFDEVSHA